jgi:hypothetical protein
MVVRISFNASTSVHFKCYRGRSDPHDNLMLTSLALFLVMIWRGGGNLGCVIGQI